MVILLDKIEDIKEILTVYKRVESFYMGWFAYFTEEMRQMVCRFSQIEGYLFWDSLRF